MAALRHIGTNTAASASVVNALLRDHNTTKITFLATEPTSTSSYSERTDGPETNLPLVVALAEYTIPGFGPISLVFDGLFLTRVRQPRAAEVDDVLATAVASGRALYAPQRVRFTSDLSAEDAAATLAKAITVPLDQGSLTGYKRLLGGP